MNRKRPQGKVPPGAAPLWRRWAGRLMGCDNAAISPMFALLLIPISGSIAFAVELGGFYYVQRSAQNAADAAAIAAATNNSATGSTYLNEARAAARPFGYVNGQDNATVSAATVTCPTGSPTGATCYQATVSTVFPVMFARVLGFTGDATNGQTIAASAIATTAGGGSTLQICALTLSTGVDSFVANGAPNADMNNCTVMSNGNLDCSSTTNNLNAAYGIAHGTNVSNKCGNSAVSNAPIVADPYSGRYSAIPSNALSSCSGSFPQLFKDKGKMVLPTTAQTTNLISGTKSWTGNQIFCGDVQLGGDVFLDGTSTTLIIENGRLDLNGHTIKTNANKGATIVFSGTPDSLSYSHYAVDLAGGSSNGIIDIAAPTSGDWSGIAVYQDPRLIQSLSDTSPVSFIYSGSQPAWKLTGLAYFPDANLTFKGAVSKASNGGSCFILLSYKLLVTGTANIFANNTGCKDAGLPDTPSTTVGGTLTREKLVF